MKFDGLVKSRNSPCLVIPAKAGIQIHMFLVPCIRRDNVWTPAGVYPVVVRGRSDGSGTFYDFIKFVI
ncbi:MAG: hypothetical protein A2156_08220 [Deltaproteobacteria bacterium RBG_16_48_10]|nr:MAG: hypothetical protein A2156_08220 [Deltaproteobacteria bacterium RBG_16_48_10]